RESVIVDDRAQALWVRGADREFLRLFPLRFVAGDKEKLLGQPKGAVISEAAAIRLFGTAQIVGRAVRMKEGDPVVIDSGLGFPEPPSHLGKGQDGISFDLLLYTNSTLRAPNSAFEKLFGFGTLVYLQFPTSGLEPVRVEQYMAEWSRRNASASFTRTFSLRP